MKCVKMIKRAYRVAIVSYSLAAVLLVLYPVYLVDLLLGTLRACVSRQSFQEFINLL